VCYATYLAALKARARLASQGKSPLYVYRCGRGRDAHFHLTSWSRPPRRKGWPLGLA